MLLLLFWQNIMICLIYVVKGVELSVYSIYDGLNFILIPWESNILLREMKWSRLMHLYQRFCPIFVYMQNKWITEPFS